MMKMVKRLKISVLILAWFVLCAKSCVEDTEDKAIIEQEQIEASRDSIRTAFSSDYLPENSLVAYEASAIQKLQDFADYLWIITDHAQGKEFRKKSAEMARQLFRSGDVTLIMPVPGENGTRAMDLDEVLKGQWAKHYLSSKLYFDSIQVAEPLRRAGTGNYLGKIECLMTLKSFLSDDSLVSEPIMVHMEIFAVREKKSFDRETLEVWKACLGNMRY